MPIERQAQKERNSHAERNDASGPIPIASIAANVSAQGATDGGDTVITLARLRPTSDGKQLDTFSISERHPIAHCEHCGAEFTPRRPHGRFCSANCRRLAWLKSNPEKAAEIAANDRARLRAHFQERGREWVDNPTAAR